MTPHITPPCRFFLKGRFVLRILCVVAALLLTAPTAHADGPLSALTTAQKGVDSCNSTLFTQAVDVTSVINTVADSLLQMLRTQTADGSITHSGLAMAVTMLDAADSSGQRALIMPLLHSEVKSLLATGINGGYFAGEPNGSVAPSPVSLASVLNSMPKGRRSIEPGKVLSEKDGKARVSATYVDPGAGRLPLVLDLERQGETWRVTGIANAPDLFKSSLRGK